MGPSVFARQLVGMKLLGDSLLETGAHEDTS